MKVDGQNPSQGTGPLDRASGSRKAAPKAGGKSFSEALGKAQNASSVPKGSPSAAAGAGSSDPPMDKHFDTIRFRLQSGYYNDPKIDDALSDKLSGLFDDFA